MSLVSDAKGAPLMIFPPAHASKREQGVSTWFCFTSSLAPRVHAQEADPLDSRIGGESLLKVLPNMSMNLSGEFQSHAQPYCHGNAPISTVARLACVYVTTATSLLYLQSTNKLLPGIKARSGFRDQNCRIFTARPP